MPSLSDSVTFEVLDRIAIVTINRPEARNAVDASVANGLSAALDEVEERRDILEPFLGGLPSHPTHQVSRRPLARNLANAS